MSAPAEKAGNRIPNPAGCRDWMALIAAFGLIVTFRLGSWPLMNPDEGRYAEISREMSTTGDWVTPRLDGVKYFEKPPLVYWLVAASETALGPSEWSVRATPALFALAGVLLTYAAARRLYGRDAGLLSAIVLGTSLFYFAVGRVLTLDMAVSTLMSATLFSFIAGVRESPGIRRRWWFYALYASAALAVLTKGLIGALLPGAIFFLWLLVFNQWRRLLPLYLPTGLAIFALIALPWHLLVARANPDWAWFYFVHEHWLRYTTHVHGRTEPWWFFLPIVWVGSFPWSGFMWPALRKSWQRREESNTGSNDLGYFAIWAVFIVFFFSLSDSKLPPYVLPAFPAIAVLIGTWLARTMKDAGGAPWRTGLRVFSILSAVLAAAFLAIVAMPSLLKQGAGDISRAWPYLAAIAVVLVAGAIQGWRVSSGTNPRASIITLAATAVLMFACVTFAAPPLIRPGTKPLAEIVRRNFQPGDKVFSYHDYFQDLPYYSGILTGIVADDWGELTFGVSHAKDTDRFISDAEFEQVWAGAGRVFVVVKKKDIAVFRAAGFGSAHTLGESRGHILFSNR